MSKLTYIDKVEIKNKQILVRVDFDVSLNPDYSIANDVRIKENLPTLKYLLKNKNRLICVAKLNRPKTRDLKHSLKPVVKRLQEYLPDYKITLVDDFFTCDQKIFKEQKPEEILVLENIRFYKEEKKNDPEFSKKLASLANIYVNDAFAVCHRSDASVVGITQFLPSFGGLLLKKEVETINKAVENPQKPMTAIIGGAKISTKINFIDKLMTISDNVLLGGCLANIFLKARGYETGISFCEQDQIEVAKNLLDKAKQNKKVIILPTDIVVGKIEDKVTPGKIKKIDQVTKDENILDIGPETQKIFATYISKARTIIWNGPMGYFENPLYSAGTNFIFEAVTKNRQAVSVVGGGDTVTAISKKENLDKITHISTGGGAMLELIEKGTLPGIEALKQ